MAVDSQPSRTLLGATSATLIVLGAFFLTVLVADSSDNAYLYLAFSGGALVVTGLPFALAALLPHGAARRLITSAALGLLALLGLLAVLLLLLAVVVIPSQNYRSSTVLVSHVVGLAALVAVLASTAMVYRRGRV